MIRVIAGLLLSLLLCGVIIVQAPAVGGGGQSHVEDFVSDAIGWTDVEDTFTLAGSNFYDVDTVDTDTVSVYTALSMDTQDQRFCARADDGGQNSDNFGAILRAASGSWGSADHYIVRFQGNGNLTAQQRTGTTTDFILTSAGSCDPGGINADDWMCVQITGNPDGAADFQLQVWGGESAAEPSDFSDPGTWPASCNCGYYMSGQTATTCVTTNAALTLDTHIAAGYDSGRLMGIYSRMTSTTEGIDNTEFGDL